MTEIKCHECKSEMESKNDSCIQYCNDCKKEIGGIVVRGDEKIHLERAWVQKNE